MQVQMKASNIEALRELRDLEKIYVLAKGRREKTNDKSDVHLPQ
jgi:hypothetical protein